ncbi:hypothetical protein LTR85_001842 [Meristemomyces frigidus]|nr:hypothetical protein LTR85_001842 [Meristemomyces frigidus]
MAQKVLPMHSGPLQEEITTRVCLLTLVVLIGAVPLLATGLASERMCTNLPAWTCLPNGRVTTYWKNDYSSMVWRPDTFLSISLGFGSYKFHVAKGIDVVWDIVVGHGGQAALVYLTYQTFAKAMLYAMESKPAPFDLYASVSFKTFSLETLWILAKRGAICARHSEPHTGSHQRSVWIFWALILASIYIIAFPVMVSAMTGYQVISVGYIRRPDTGDLVSLAHLYPTQWVLVDGHRVGFGDDYHIPYGSSLEQDFSSYMMQYGGLPGTAANHTANDPKGVDRNQSSAISVNSQWLDLDPPLLTSFTLEPFGEWFILEGLTLNVNDT